jgi:hypothetical protein
MIVVEVTSSMSCCMNGFAMVVLGWSSIRRPEDEVWLFTMVYMIKAVSLM